jgi:hypothetical protein
LAGAATYNGIAAFGDKATLDQTNAGNPDVLASMALAVNFGTARVTGAIWGFRGKDGKVGDGSVTLKGLQDANTLKASGSSTIYWGPRLCCANRLRDSCRESSVVTGVHEQTYITYLQDHELGCL